MTPVRWLEPFRVRAYEIDPDARLTVPSLCDWLQEAAGNHATDLGVATDRLLEEGRAWVLTRLCVSINQFPRWRAAVTVETWPSGENGLVADRDFVVSDDEGRVLASATSQWVVIDIRRRRPVRLPAEVLAITLPDRERALVPPNRPIPPPEALDVRRSFSVRRSDLDLNRHVNNARYVEWALEALPDGVDEQMICTWLDVQFRSESVYGDEIVAASGEVTHGDAGLTVRHSVARTAGDILAVLETGWRPARQLISS